MMSNTEVLHVIARMNVGGTARYVQELVDNIPNSKLATGFVQGEEIEDSSTERLPIFRIKHLGRRISPVNDYKAWKELRRVIHEQKPKIVHTHTFKAGLIGRLIGGNHKRIHTFHGHLFNDDSFSELEKFLIIQIEKFLARKTDILISVGNQVGAELRASGVGKTRNWISIAPGVKPLRLISKSSSRKELGLLQGEILVGWLARMAPVKNPGFLLEVASRLPSVNFVMAGGGELFDSIWRLAPANVKVLGWVDASVFWSAVDIAISTSNNEGMPIALIEAQLAGIPVIATDVGSNREVILHKITGIISNQNIENFKEEINWFVQNPKMIASIGRNANLHALRAFSIDQFIKSHRDAYDGLINPQIEEI